METSGTRRVVVVDDDEWLRRGMADGLREVPRIDVVAAISHGTALTWDGEWSGVDVVLVDAYDAEEEWDRFPGVAVVEAVRARRTAAETLVIVVSGHIMNDHLRLRMAGAGADFYYGRSELRSPDRLAAAILQPEAARRATPGDAARLAALGLRPTSRPNAALAFLRASGSDALFAPGVPQKHLGASRRSLITLRRRVARLAGLSPRPGTAVGATVVRDVPSWRDVVGFVEGATGRDVGGARGHDVRS